MARNQLGALEEKMMSKTEWVSDRIDILERVLLYSEQDDESEANVTSEVLTALNSDHQREIHDLFETGYQIGRDLDTAELQYGSEPI